MAMTQQTLDGSSVDEHEGEIQCPECKRWFSKIGQHWGPNPSHLPTITEKQRQIIEGHLLGDGSYEVPLSNANNRFCLERFTTKPYMKWLKRCFPYLSGKITRRETAAEQASRDYERGYNTDVENYKDNYALKFSYHPQLDFAVEWIENEGFVDDFSLTPLSLKVWYVCDGNLHYKNGRYEATTFKCTDKISNRQSLLDIFESLPFDATVTKERVRIGRSQAEAFFDYIGEPPTASQAGFAYKWQYDSYENYCMLKQINHDQPYINDE